MKAVIDNREREVIIDRKRSNKNTYLRVKEDYSIYVTTNYFTKEKDILKLIYDNEKSIIRMTNRIENKIKDNNKFMYLGKEYNLIYWNSKDILLGDNKLFLSKDTDIKKWLLKQAKVIFKEELDKYYNIFPIKIPYPSLTIRSMTTRWGVCNVKTKRVTLNLELIKKDIKYLDYVIVHELSHLIHANHSKDFWNLVGSIIPDYKKLRKELNNYE